MVAAAAALGILTGCPERPKTSAPDAGADAGVAQAPLPDLKFAVRYEAPDAGMLAIPFEPGSRPVIDPTQKLEVSANLGLKNYRIRLFDEADRAVISDDEALDTPTLDYRIQLPAPLKTGRKYTLLVDAQTGDTFTDSAGRPHPDQRIELQISGEKEKDKPATAAKPPASKHKKHRR